MQLDEQQKNVKVPKRNRYKYLSIVDTKYDVVKEIGLSLNFKLINDPNDNNWDLYWTDQAVQAEQLAKMKSHQKINHWPGMFTLSRKNNLGITLMRFRKKFQSYNFFPMTWIVPADNNDLKQQFSQKQNKIFIVKPEASCQGKGIFLVNRHQDIPAMESFVVQRYIDKPYLIDGLKFDLRLYVLLAGIDPLRVYLYKEGMARFATEPYQPPNQNNLSNVCQHLTNYAINMQNPNYIFNQDSNKNNVGHKRSFSSILQHLKNEGHNVDQLMIEIKEIFIKTFITTQPVIAHHYKSCQPDNYKNNMCFEILGIDVMLDSKLKPWLIEVNHTPSFTTDTPFDYQIKSEVIKDTMKLININENDKQIQMQKQKDEFERRIFQGFKKVHLNAQQKQVLIDEGQKERDEWELNNLGGFECITNQINKDEINEYLQFSNQIYQDSTGGYIKRNQSKENNIKINQIVHELDLPENDQNITAEPKYSKNTIEFSLYKFENQLNPKQSQQSCHFKLTRLQSPPKQHVINKKQSPTNEFIHNLDNNFLNIKSLQNCIQQQNINKQNLYFLPSIKKELPQKQLAKQQLQQAAKSSIISDYKKQRQYDYKKYYYQNE